MVKLIVLENLDSYKTEYQGNFIRLVDRGSGDSEIYYLTSKGIYIKLNYDVQGAVLELINERDSQARLAVNYKSALRGIEEKNLRVGEIIEAGRDDSLSQWVENAKVIKSIFSKD